MTEMDLSRNSAKYCDCFTVVLTLTVPVATAKRSFSKLKIIKSYLRSSVSQDCLSNLSLISFEHETVEIYFDLVIRNFASAKAPKVKYGNIF